MRNTNLRSSADFAKALTICPKELCRPENGGARARSNEPLAQARVIFKGQRLLCHGLSQREIKRSRPQRNVPATSSAHGSKAASSRRKQVRAAKPSTKPPKASAEKTLARIVHGLARFAHTACSRRRIGAFFPA